MKPRYIFLRVMVFSMKYMTRYLSFIAIPFVKWYASIEIIACGLREKDGNVNIIYSPQDKKTKYTFLRKEGRKWVKESSKQVNKFSKPVVHQINIPKAKLGEVYRVYTEKKNIHSPNITVKEVSIDLSKIIKAKTVNGKLNISWKEGEKYDPMIYFLAVENEKKETVAAIYTRENSWTYPFVKKASFSLLDNPKELGKGEKYYVKLVIVDFDGWVSGMGSKEFRV